VTDFAELLAEFLAAQLSGFRLLPQQEWLDYQQQHSQRLAQLLQAARELTQRTTALELHNHNLRMENARLRKRGQSTGRAPAAATEAYRRLVDALRAYGVPEDQLRAALTTLFHEDGLKHPGEAVRNILGKRPT
jgi:regulator of replication initiation timing